MHPLLYALQWVRSLIFVIVMYVMLTIMGILFFPFALMSSTAARFACKTFCAWVIWSARWMVGIKTEVRGTPPSGEVMIAAKHQSFLDIIVIFYNSPKAKFIMKRELIWAPFVGQYGLRIGCVPVNRGKRAEAIKKMLADVAAGQAEAGQLVIYPQGTRVAPGVPAPYKIGTGALYETLGQPCVPVATNVGVLWPKRGIMRKPGVAVIEFLDEIPSGLRAKELMVQLEDVIETRSDALMAEAGFELTA